MTMMTHAEEAAFLENRTSTPERCGSTLSFFSLLEQDEQRGRMTAEDAAAISTETPPPPVGEDDEEPNEDEESIERACKEYTASVRLTLATISADVTDNLSRNMDSLEELCDKIQARTLFLETNPSFLASLHRHNDMNTIIDMDENLVEFDQIKIALKDNSLKINDKLNEIEQVHNRLFDLVFNKGTNPRESVERITIGHIGSDQSIELKPTDSPFKFKYSGNKPTDVPVDVSKGRPFEDLHGRLVQQLEATDSLEGFLKLMERKPGENSVSPRRRRSSKRSPSVVTQQHSNHSNSASRTSANHIIPNQRNISHVSSNIKKCLEDKYTGSLWFFHQKELFNRHNHNLIRGAISQKVGPIKKQTSRNLLLYSSQPALMTNEERSRRMKSSLGRGKLKCYDLLDDIDNRDLTPLESEYPRRDNLPSTTSMTGGGRKQSHQVQKIPSYLHRMLHENDDQVWRKLLQPQGQVRAMRHHHRNVRNLVEFLRTSKSKHGRQFGRSFVTDLSRITLPSQCGSKGGVKMTDSSDRNHMITTVELDKAATTNNTISGSSYDPLDKAKTKVRDLMHYLTTPRLAPSSECPKPAANGVTVMPVSVKYYDKDRVTDLVNYLTHPCHRQEVIIAMPVKMYYDSYPTKETPQQQSNNGTVTDLSQGEQIRTPPFGSGVKCQSPKYQSQYSTPRKTTHGPVVEDHHNNTSTPFLTPRRSSFVEDPKDFKTGTGTGGAPVMKSPRSDTTSNDLIRKMQQHQQLQHLFNNNNNNNKSKSPNATPRGNKIPSPLNRKKVMLEHLRGLKARNDTIQKNIQKAIDVIETKMIDILSSPPDSNSSEAFTAMEQEITKVLKMMNEGEKKELEKKIEKFEAEKDENHILKTQGPASGKLKRANTTVKQKAAPHEVVPGVDLMTMNARKSPTHSSKSPRKGADIEEGERLLGQVDNVIQKIDNMYTKLHSKQTGDNGKKAMALSDQQLPVAKQPNHVVDFFDNLKKIIEVPVLHVKRCENIAARFQQARLYHQPRVYHSVIVMPTPNPGPFGMTPTTPITTATTKENGDCYVRSVGTQQQMATALSETSASNTDDEIEEVVDGRHELALKTFYTLFFSTVLMALNFDYSC